ncbi:MAG TPA: NfeD family protein [Saprospiraceae bacterium]|nr:NfeD family protein [Saprospiraceae bacterium]
MEFFNEMEPLLRSFWYIAIPTSVIFCIQSVMTFMGADSHDGTQADFDSDLEHGDSVFQLFSLRNLIHFLLGLSWSGISFYSFISNKLLLGLVSVGIGILFVYLFFVIIRQLQTLAEDNSFRISSVLYMTAEVYLTVPAFKNGRGKIMVSVNGTFHELDAMTENEKIETGSLVKIVRIENQNILIVEKI